MEQLVELIGQWRFFFAHDMHQYDPADHAHENIQQHLG